MRKWCPEPLDGDHLSPRTAPDGFAADAPACETGDAGPRFETDTALTGGNSLWNIIGQAEREALLQEAREQLEEEFAARESALREELGAAADEARAAFDARFDVWAREFTAGQSAEHEATAADAARLAVALARKIIRDTAAVDDAMVARTLETVLYKIQDDRRLTVIVNPTDALLLEADPELRRRLRIGEVVADRRIEQGGCRVRAGACEWDATIAGQMDALVAVVDEAVEQWCRPHDKSPDPGADHDTGLV
jgi:flagellar biosynthesis/type III secretory pathway protein FliH